MKRFFSPQLPQATPTGRLQLLQVIGRALGHEGIEFGAGAAPFPVGELAKCVMPTEILMQNSKRGTISATGLWLRVI